MTPQSGQKIIGFHIQQKWENKHVRSLELCTKKTVSHQMESINGDEEFNDAYIIT